MAEVISVSATEDAIDQDVNNNNENLTYEELRMQNIKRNEEYLRSLGLLNNKAADRVGSSSSKKKSTTTKKRLSTKDIIDINDEDYEPTVRRRSKRLSGDTDNDLYFIDEDTEVIKRTRTDNTVVDLLDNVDFDEIENEDSNRIKITAPQLRDFIDNQNIEHSDLLDNGLIEHTAYRMSYMSARKLQTRLKAVAKSAKKSSYEKLLVFFYALLLAGLPGLADIAKVTLEKLDVTFS